MSFRKRILIVEGDKRNLEVLRDVVERFGYQPVLARNRVEALEKLD